MAKNGNFSTINTITPESARRTGVDALSPCEMYPHEVAERFSSDMDKGLNSKGVKKNRSKYGPNIANDNEFDFVTVLKRQYTNLLTVLLLCGALTVFAFVKDKTVLLVAGGSVILTFVNAFLQYRAGLMLKRLKKQTASGATVIRNGQTLITDSRSVVCGDVICLEEGSIVPADARLIETNNLTVLETPVSGIKYAVKKDARFMQKDSSMRVSENMVYSGSIVTGGKGVAIVCNVGEGVLSNKKNVKGSLKNLPSVLAGVRKEAGIISLISAFLEIFIICVCIFTGVDIVQGFMIAVSIGVMALTDTAEAFSAYAFAECLIKALEKGAAVRNLNCIPGLVGVNSVMCDKQTAFPPTIVKTDRVYDCFNTYKTESESNKSAEEVLRYLLLCCSVKEKAAEGKQKKQTPQTVFDKYSGSLLELSFMAAAEEIGLTQDKINDNFYRIEAEFDSRGETTRVLGLLNGNPVVIIKGSPENVISRCAGYRQNGTNYRFDDKSKRRAIAFVEEISKTRTPIAIAVGHTAADSLRDITVERKLVLVGFAGLYETFEVGAASAVYKCKKAGVEIVVSSDDAYYTAFNTAKNSGIIDTENEMCTAEMLRNTEPGLFIANCPGYKVFIGLTDGEWQYVKELRESDGKKVAVSVSKNEQLPLIKHAIASFAPKRGTTDTVLASCDVQMNNDGFDTITQTLISARMAMKRIANTSEYFSVGFLTMFFWVLFSIIAFKTIPVSSTDIFLYGLIINILISIPLAFAPPERNILAEHLPSVKPKDKFGNYAFPFFYGIVGGGLCLLSSVLTQNSGSGASLTCSLFTFASLLFFYSMMCGSKHSLAENKAYSNYMFFVMLSVCIFVMGLFTYVPALSAMMGYFPIGTTDVIIAISLSLSLFMIVQIGIAVMNASKKAKNQKNRPNNKKA